MASMLLDEAAHLVRRMGFGASLQEVADLAQRGREAAIDYLLNYERIDNSALEQALERDRKIYQTIDDPRFPFEVRTRIWWFVRMAATCRPFEEKMTLFWHNHFATSVSKVPSLLMFLQNQTFRKYALDRFDTLLLKIAQDPAMLHWLDGITNVVGRPNDNFARELQELFSMGITDAVTGAVNYTERDVREIARAFTGWKFRQPEKLTINKLKKVKFFINEIEHDNGLKTVYGQTANFSGEDIITLIAARPSTARFLVKKFFEFFVYPLTQSAEDGATIERLAEVYFRSNHSIKELARAIFLSDEFFSERARFALIKNPAELMIGPLRMLGINDDLSPADLFRDSASVARSQAMGLDLFAPPSVGGWELNLGWVNTATMMERYNYLSDLTGLYETMFGAGTHRRETYERHTHTDAETTVKNFLMLFGPLDVEDGTLQILIDYLHTDDQGNRVGFTPDGPTIDNKVRGLAHLILCLPQFHLN
jgi:uncharacterized protein (DUF1800 family)